MRWIAILISMIMLPATLNAGVVRLRESVVIESSIMTVGDLAEISESDRYRHSQIAGVEIGPAPEAESPKWIDLNDIKEALTREGIRFDDITFQGSRRVEVRQTPNETTRVIVRKSREHWRAEIERLVRESLEQEARRSADAEPFSGSGPAEGIRIRVEGERLLDYLVEQVHSKWQLVLTGPWQEGWQQARVDITIDEDRLRYPVMIHLLPARQVVVPRITLARGTKISPDDVTLVAYEKDSSDRELVTDLQQAVGQEAKRDLQAGEPISSRDLRKTPIVFRGQPVTVHIRFGTAWLQKTFLAASDAGLGDWIEIYESNGRSGQAHPYQVRVIASHTAELPPDAPPSRAQVRPATPTRAPAAASIAQRNNAQRTRQ
ncbi:flagellar basal body P-ring formation chaperone FlgA [bacterium]|nr:flagellar basal body P-ring formation chaperone FlgA [bacterium]